MGSDYPVTTSMETCAECLGDGFIIVFGTTADRTATSPPEHREECPICRGDGCVEVDRCARCGLATSLGPLGYIPNEEHDPWDVCHCDEDVLMIWERTPKYPETGEAARDVASYWLGQTKTQAAYVRRIRATARYLRSINSSWAAPRLGDALMAEAEYYDYPVEEEALPV